MISENARILHMAGDRAFFLRRAGQGVLRLKPHPARAGEQEPTSRLLLDSMSAKESSVYEVLSQRSST